MPEQGHVATDLDARLAEIDSRLRSIQAELAPGPDQASSGPSQLRAVEAVERVDGVEAEPPRERREPPMERRGGRGRSGPLEELLQRRAGAAQAPERETVEPRPVAPEGDSLEHVQALTDVHMRLLASSYELLEAYQELIERLQDAANAAPIEVTVDAGPFMSLDAVRDFERALAQLPGVLDVAVRGYERGNRAIVDVELRPPRT